MSARLVFTAHSIPLPMAEASRYREQLAGVGASVVAEAGMRDWALVYQSRSGRPAGSVARAGRLRLPARRAGGGTGGGGVLCPIGFVCDHIEVLYDLDREAADVCREIGLPMVRAEAVNDDPLFLDMMADVVLDTIAVTGRPAVADYPVRLKPDTTCV